MFITSTPAVLRAVLLPGLRASATARARSAAPPAAVWALLADPARWSQLHPCVDSVTPIPPDPAADEPGQAGDGVLRAGEKYAVRLRLLPASVPVRVEHVVERSVLALSVEPVPGLLEDLEVLLMPTMSGGSVVTVRLTLRGPLALAALAPRWLERAMSARLLARAAARGPQACPAAAAVA